VAGIAPKQTNVVYDLGLDSIELKKMHNVYFGTKPVKTERDRRKAVMAGMQQSTLHKTMKPPKTRGLLDEEDGP
jgi:hypothetical protein